MRTDVLVVGAGFAGSVIAERCASAGMSVWRSTSANTLREMHLTSSIVTVSWYTDTDHTSSIPMLSRFRIPIEVH